MSHTKHTPGPWVIDETYGLIMARQTEIAACHSGIKANATLIAAAPELLETVATIYAFEGFEALLKTKYSPALVSDLMLQLRSAIDKATGGAK